MQSVTSLLVQQLTDMKNKLFESSPPDNNRFNKLPQTVAATLGASLLAEHCGFKSVASSSNQLALTCYRIAQAMPQDSEIEISTGRTLGRLDYYQAAANLSPNTKTYWLKLAETLGEHEKIKVGSHTYSKEECLLKSAPLPAMALWSKQTKQGQTGTHQGGCA